MSKNNLSTAVVIAVAELSKSIPVQNNDAGQTANECSGCACGGCGGCDGRSPETTPPKVSLPAGTCLRIKSNTRAA